MFVTFRMAQIDSGGL